ncbi:hypothetical protein, conserved [Plasmodium gonderi]|uniref:Uncharacterized protein n=1 Tax=Plasmodium gonderi TaxID=77519 RepID=A0A1Y1JB71_PLAGO|nr:hypothetical protein, conserved [Plasmodium gonderi]GAW78938.1 hypothetical protein, conserved [Plasmodium gonderi]
MNGWLLRSIHTQFSRSRNGNGKCCKQLVPSNPSERPLCTSRCLSSTRTLCVDAAFEKQCNKINLRFMGYTSYSSWMGRWQTFGYGIITNQVGFSTTSTKENFSKGGEEKKNHTKQHKPVSENEKNESLNQDTNEINSNDDDIYGINENMGKKKKKSKLKLIVYTFTIGFGFYVIYKVYQNDMNLSKAEESIVKDIVNLIYTYEEKMSIQNSKFVTCLDENLNKQIAMYFIQLDTDKSSGFLINDAINFLKDLNIKEDNTIVKNFIKNGNGKNIEMKKLSGCSLQQFAELIESLILTSKAKNENSQFSSATETAASDNKYYMNLLQQYLNCFINLVKTSDLYLYYQMKKNASSSSDASSKAAENMDDLEISILNKLTKYNDKYVDKKNLSLDYLLSNEELRNFRQNNNVSKKEEEKELLLIEKKKLEEKIQLLLKLQSKKNLTETEIKRLQDLKIKLRNIKYIIKKEELKKYFQMK